MPRILLLCFVHGFKGKDVTFNEFPHHLKRRLERELPEKLIETIIYPTYETKGKLAEATQAFLQWLKERVIDVRKTHLEKAWPPNDSEVAVVLVAHSMGGFVAADALFLSLNQQIEAEAEGTAQFPLIKGILTFDTPFNGLARSMFVYGAFSNYQKVSSAYNIAAALGAAAPIGLRSLDTRHATGSSAVPTTPRSNLAWKTWQLVAVRTGTIGAIAAGGVAAYRNQEAIIKGLQNLGNIDKETVAAGYRQGIETIGQGLAYINPGILGQSFAWLSDHFTFVGALLKQKELSRRLDRLGAIKGVGIRNFYTSLGENGCWSGGYFVPERTFCAVPTNDHPAFPLFTRYIIQDSDDEVTAHTSIFKKSGNNEYERMVDEATECVREWFLSEGDVSEDPRFRDASPEEVVEDSSIEETLEEQEKLTDTDTNGAESAFIDNGYLPDQCPVEKDAIEPVFSLQEDAGRGLKEDDTQGTAV
ncbi:hypothetical protein HIM_00794 [Hirsutella minnesotensis 3608]|nr:hypothetical protein HIM_00794 [Hirsutella minnesotensis 3608]